MSYILFELKNFINCLCTIDHVFVLKIAQFRGDFCGGILAIHLRLQIEAASAIEKKMDRTNF